MWRHWVGRLMGLFGRKDEMDLKDATINDSDWRELQGRALKANPQMRDTFSAESQAGRERGNANYRNRHSN